AAVQDEAFSAYLNRPELSPKEKVKLFTQVLGEQQSEALSNFIVLLAENDRLSLLPEVANEYEALKSQNNNVVDVVIESAFPLTAVQEQLLTDALVKRFNAKVQVTVEVN
ncbi:ATP synthase F1 subunit delta, partial [Pseudomonas syringae]